MFDTLSMVTGGGASAEPAAFPEPVSGVVLAAAATAVRVDELPDHALLDAICDWDRVIAWAQAQQCAALAEFADRRPVSGDERAAFGDSPISEWAIDEISAALRLSRNAAGHRLHVATELRHRLTGTAAALARGDLDFPKARAIVEATSALDPATAAAVEARVLPRAPRQTAGQLRASLARAVLTADPTSAEDRHQRAAADRRVTITPLPDGMAELWALLTADAATAIYTAIDALARQQPRTTPRRVAASASRTHGPGTSNPATSGVDNGTMDARRADALVALTTRGATTANPATDDTDDPGTNAHRADAPTTRGTTANTTACGIASDSAGVDDIDDRGTDAPANHGTAARYPDTHSPGVDDTDDRDTDDRGMDARRADALLALITGAATTPMRPLVHLTVAATTLLGLDDNPADLAGHGPIPATLARHIAADPTGTWHRILTDPTTATPTDIGTRSYRPPAALTRRVTIRDQRCRFPTCRQPAHRCDLDHITPWPNGPTTAANLTTLCRRHHRLKHTNRWQVTGTGNAGLTWTAPTGHTYTTHPEPMHPPQATGTGG